jgi:hypothetical protein
MLGGVLLGVDLAAEPLQLFGGEALPTDRLDYTRPDLTSFDQF